MPDLTFHFTNILTKNSNLSLGGGGLIMCKEKDSIEIIQKWAIKKKRRPVSFL